MDTPMNFDPMTGQPTVEGDGQSPKKKKGLIIGIIAASVALVAVLTVCFFVFFAKSPKAQIAAAMKNTYTELKEKNLLIQDLNFPEFDESEEKTVEVELETEIPSIGDISFFANVCQNKDTIQMSGDVNLSYIPSIEYVLQLDKSKLSVYTPIVDNYVFTYDYTKKNEGYVPQLLKEESIDLNGILSNIYDSTFAFDKERSDEVMESLKEIGEKIEFEKIDSKEFEIDNEMVKCKGFRASVDPKDVKEFLVEYYDKLGNIINPEGEPMSEIMSEALSDFDTMGEVAVKAYLYDDMMVAFSVEPEGEESVGILFKGGDYRAQNVEFTVDDETTLKIEGSKEGSVETFEFSNGNPSVLTLEYNQAEGDLNVGITGMESLMSFNIDKSDKKMKIEMKILDMGDTYVGGNIELSTGAEIKEFEPQNEFDFGTASEADFEQLIEEISGVVMGALGMGY